MGVAVGWRSGWRLDVAVADGSGGSIARSVGVALQAGVAGVVGEAARVGAGVGRAVRVAAGTGVGSRAASVTLGRMVGADVGVAVKNGGSGISATLFPSSSTTPADTSSTRSICSPTPSEAVSASNWSTSIFLTSMACRLKASSFARP